MGWHNFHSAFRGCLYEKQDRIKNRMGGFLSHVNFRKQPAISYAKSKNYCSDILQHSSDISFKNLSTKY